MSTLPYEPVIQPLKEWPGEKMIGYFRKAHCRNMTHNLKGECSLSTSHFSEKSYYRYVNFFSDLDRYVEPSIRDIEILDNII